MLNGDPKSPAPLIPAATALLLRDTHNGIEVLMLRRNRALKAFGGAWVFPGGRVDDADGPGLTDIERAKITAIRETKEETDLDISGTKLATLSNWIPPVEEKRRFSTWFFVGQAPDAPVIIDDGEIHDYQWISPKSALSRVPADNFIVLPPTFVSLHALQDYETASTAVEGIKQTDTEIFKTKFARGPNGFITLWPGDAAYDDLDFTKAGVRRRLYANPDGWIYETT